MLGRLALAAGDTAAAGKHLAAAAGRFRDGDYLTELATTLADLADCAQASGDPDAAERYAAEAIAIAAPRGLVPAQSAALAARARIRAARATATADPDLLFQGRDAADAALRLAVRHHLAWHELDALRAHARLDQAEGVDRGWAAKADAVHTRLVPPGLDPDPLATVERLVAAQKGRRGQQPRKARTDGRYVDQRAGRHPGRGGADPAHRGRARLVRRPGQPPPGAGPVGQPDRGHPPPGRLLPARPGPEPAAVLRHFVGGWKEIQPGQAIAVKRKLDETMYANRVLFSEQLFTAYHQFMAVLFAMYASTNADALLRAPVESVWGNRRTMSWWNEESMAGLFTATASSIDDIQAAHDELAERFRADLYVTRQNQPLLATRP